MMKMSIIRFIVTVMFLSSVCHSQDATTSLTLDYVPMTCPANVKDGSLITFRCQTSCLCDVSISINNTVVVRSDHNATFKVDTTLAPYSINDFKFSYSACGRPVQSSNCQVMVWPSSYVYVRSIESDSTCSVGLRHGTDHYVMRGIINATSTFLSNVVDIENMPYSSSTFSVLCRISLSSCYTPNNLMCYCARQDGSIYEIVVNRTASFSNNDERIRIHWASSSAVSVVSDEVQVPRAYNLNAVTTSFSRNNFLLSCPATVTYGSVLRFQCQDSPSPCVVAIAINDREVARGEHIATYIVPTNLSLNAPYRFTLSHSVCGGPMTSTTCLVTVREATNAETTPSPNGNGNDNVHQDYACHLNYMSIHIPVDLVPESKLWLNEPSCQLVNNGTHHIIDFFYQECGTDQRTVGNYTIFKNEITVHTDIDVSAPVVFGEDYKINVSCRIPKYQLVEGSVQVVSNVQIYETSENTTTMGYVLKEYETADYQKEITTYPVQVPYNRIMYFQISLNDQDKINNTFGIHVDKCVATPSLSNDDSTKFLLIENGCPHPSVHVLASPGPEVYRFWIHSFRFSGPENKDNMLYIHCTTSLCLKTSCPVQCSSSSTGRRKRWSRNRSPATLTIGPYIFGH